jgi:hypothetical protein
MTARSDSRRFAVALLAVTAPLLGGCAASGGAQSGGADFRNTYNYLPVNDQPPERPQPLMSTEEQAKAREALTAARDHQSLRPAKQVTNPVKQVTKQQTRGATSTGKPRDLGHALSGN